MSKDYNKLQTIILTLADGKKLSYTGPKQLDSVEGIVITKIQFTEGRPIPPGCTFEEYEDLKVGGVIG